MVTVDLTAGRVPPERQLRVFLNFGEHGRELITSDVAERLLRLLAAGPEAAARTTRGGEAAARALRRTVFKVVPLENAGGRAKVEAGELCLRKNGRGVDTNRNWGAHWGFKEKDYDPYEEAAGARPFSEPEACLLRDAVAAWRPHAWVNVHSGMRALFMPFDHVADTPRGRAGEALRAVLAALKQQHCADCVTGSGGASVGYLAHGTATDFMYLNLSVPVAMTWEIYGDLQAPNDDCFRMFNPLTRTEHDRVVATWAAACLALPGALMLHPDVPQPRADDPTGGVAWGLEAARAHLRGGGRVHAASPGLLTAQAVPTQAAKGRGDEEAVLGHTGAWAAGSLALLLGVAAASYASGKRVRPRADSGGKKQSV